MKKKNGENESFEWLVDCERVLYFLNTTKTKTGLSVTSQLDVGMYLSKAEKKKQGIPEVTEKTFLDIADIIYPHDKDALKAWNYMITSK